MPNQLSSEDLTLLRDTANRFFEDKMPISAFRQLREITDGDGFDRGCWEEMASMGWTGILIPEDNGGIDMGYTALGTILEASGRTLAASPLVSTALAGAVVIKNGASVARRDTILNGVASGELTLALAVDEAKRHAPRQVDTTAAETKDGFVINGEKSFVVDGHVADELIVTARTSGSGTSMDGISVFLVPGTAKGVERRRTRMVDSRNAANLRFRDVALPADALLGELHNGYNLIEQALDAARAGLAAEMLGVGLEAFDRTVEYLKVREQFGAPIGSFQALKHRAAEMYCAVELARSSVYAALDALDNDAVESAELASLAKVKACDMLELVSNEAVQMHGGIGMTDEVDIGLFLKRARVAQQTFGDALFHRDRYATLIGL